MLYEINGWMSNMLVTILIVIMVLVLLAVMVFLAMIIDPESLSKDPFVEVDEITDTNITTE